eukprot:9451144-Pyramimonas_sp.AAC.1
MDPSENARRCRNMASSPPPTSAGAGGRATGQNPPVVTFLRFGCQSPNDIPLQGDTDPSAHVRQELDLNTSGPPVLLRLTAHVAEVLGA